MHLFIFFLCIYLKHPHEIISVAAVAALRAITRAYFAQGMYIIYSILYLASI